MCNYYYFNCLKGFMTSYSICVITITCSEGNQFERKIQYFIFRRTGNIYKSGLNFKLTIAI